MESLTHGNDFVNVLTYSMYYFRDQNWVLGDDPYPANYYGNITSQNIVWPETSSLSSSGKTIIEHGGWGNLTETLTDPVLSMIGYIHSSYLSGCELGSLDARWSFHDPKAFICTNKALHNSPYLAYRYLFCTQWGLFQTGSGAPMYPLPVASGLLTVDWYSLPCKLAFNIITPPNNAQQVLRLEHLV